MAGFDQNHPPQLATSSADLLAQVSVQKPRVHCITNDVAVNYTANSLLAVGAIPSMTSNPSEVEDFVSGSDALLINLGTLGNEKTQAIENAVETATARAIPWCLDPVFIERSKGRLAFAQQLVKLEPQVVRGNCAELEALGLILSGEGTGTDQCIAMTGANDMVRQQHRVATIGNGHPLMARVTATGCALGALIAAFLAVSDDPFQATVAAITCIGISGEIAAQQSAGPGSFQNLLLDQLYCLDRTTILGRALIQ